MGKPVKVYILMGQSNMLEMGRVKGGDGSLEHAVKEKTLYQWAELGQIPSIKMQGCLRFDLDDVMKWIETCKRVPHNCN